MSGAVQERVLYWTVRCCVGLLGLLPRPVGLLLCRAVGATFYHLDRKHRRIGLVNLIIAFPEQDDEWRKRILKESFRQLGTHAVDISRLVGMDRSQLARRVDYEAGRGLEHYRSAKSEGKGVIFLTAHIGSWEMLPAAHAVLGHPLSFVVRPLDNSPLDRWVNAWRSRFGNEVISKYGSLRPVLKRLRAGDDVGLLIDQNVQEKDGVYAPLFGKPACTTSSAAALALKTECPVIMGFLIPGSGNGRYRIRFYPPLKMDRVGTLEEDLVHNTARFNRCIEEVIREFPSCWLWGHRRYRTQPDGSDPYQWVE